MTVVVLVFCLALLCLIARPSAKRTILLTTPTTPLLTKTFRTKRKNSSEETQQREKKAVNPVYWWLVQPQKETGLKEGRFREVIKLKIC